MAHSRAIFGGALCLLAAALLWHTYSPTYLGMGIGAEFGPMFYPRILLVLWILLSLGVVVEALWLSGQPVERQRWGHLFGMLLLVGACTYLLSAIGFLFASILFCVTACLFMGYTGPIGLALTGIIFPTTTWYLFHEVLLIRLPTSPWFTWV